MLWNLPARTRRHAKLVKRRHEVGRVVGESSRTDSRTPVGVMGSCLVCTPWRRLDHWDVFIHIYITYMRYPCGSSAFPGFPPEPFAGS